MALNGRGLALATALILAALPGVVGAQAPRIGKPRPAPRTAPNIPPLPPAVLDNRLAIGGEDLKARKVETRLTFPDLANGRLFGDVYANRLSAPRRRHLRSLA